MSHTSRQFDKKKFSFTKIPKILIQVALNFFLHLAFFVPDKTFFKTRTFPGFEAEAAADKPRAKEQRTLETKVSQKISFS